MIFIHIPPAGYYYLKQPLASIITDSDGSKKSTQLLLVDSTKLQKQRYELLCTTW